MSGSRVDRSRLRHAEAFEASPATRNASLSTRSADITSRSRVINADRMANVSPVAHSANGSDNWGASRGEGGGITRSACSDANSAEVESVSTIDRTRGEDAAAAAAAAAFAPDDEGDADGGGGV